MTVEKLYLLFKSMMLSHGKVLKLLKEPLTNDEAEGKTWFYLRNYIGDMSDEELRRFVRFVTGSFVISVKSTLQLDSIGWMDLYVALLSRHVLQG